MLVWPRCDGLRWLTQMPRRVKPRPSVCPAQPQHHGQRVQRCLGETVLQVEGLGVFVDRVAQQRADAGRRTPTCRAARSAKPVHQGPCRSTRAWSFLPGRALGEQAHHLEVAGQRRVHQLCERLALLCIDREQRLVEQHLCTRVHSRWSWPAHEYRPCISSCSRLDHPRWRATPAAWSRVGRRV